MDATERPRWMTEGSGELSDLDGLLAREHIRDLVTRYNSNSDTGRFGPVPELFAVDAVMELATGDGSFDTYEGRDAIMTIFTGTQERIATRPEATTPPYVRHYTATHQIDLADAEHASGRCYFAVILASGLDHWGRYLDRYVRDTDGRWRFAHRVERPQRAQPEHAVGWDDVDMVDFNRHLVFDLRHLHNRVPG